STSSPPSCTRRRSTRGASTSKARGEPHGFPRGPPSLPTTLAAGFAAGSATAAAGPVVASPLLGLSPGQAGLRPPIGVACRDSVKQEFFFRRAGVHSVHMREAR